MAIKVTLRQKSISKGRKSLYLDFYPPIIHSKTGEPTRREFLGLYIPTKNKNPLDKLQIEETLKIAEAIKQNRFNTLNKPEIYNEFEKNQLRIKELGEQSFLEYFRMLTKKRNGSNYENWKASLEYFEAFTNGRLLFKDLNLVLLEEFKEYLLTTSSKRSSKKTLSKNSASSYFNKLKAALKQAHKDDILQVDLNAKVTSIKEEESLPEHLSLEELNTLVQTPCKSEVLKTAAIFSGLTGLRFSDIEKMTWSEVEHINTYGFFIDFRQRKTASAELMPISKQAYELMGERKNPSDKIFTGLTYSSNENKYLHDWIAEAGIKKHVTFHDFRHTYATLQLLNGTDIYTVSKMLGHKNLKTTQIYAKVVDEAKRKTIDRIKLKM